MTNQPFGTLYIGVTNDLVKRIWEHKHGMRDGFTKRYGLSRLVYYESFDTIDAAMHREKSMKKWNRSWKLKRIVGNNPEWNDLYNDFVYHATVDPYDGSPPSRG